MGVMLYGFVTMENGNKLFQMIIQPVDRVENLCLVGVMEMNYGYSYLKKPMQNYMDLIKKLKLV